MDSVCGYQGCIEKAYWRCTCQEQYRLCKSHMKKHSTFVGCFSKSFDPNLLLARAKSKGNVLKRLNSESVWLAEKMIIEINKCLKENFADIKEWKKQINIFILNNQDEQAENILKIASKFDLIHREQIEFSVSTRNLLSIKENTTNEINNFQKLQEEFENLKIEHEKAKDKIGQQDKEISTLKTYCRDREIEIENYQKQYKEAQFTIKNTQKELTRLQQMCKDNQSEIARYKLEVENSKNSLEKSINKNLESEFADKMKVLEKTQAKLEKYDSNIAIKEDSLINANSRIKTSTSELEESNKRIQDLKQENLTKLENNKASII